VEFLLPYPTVLNGWRRAITHAYEPEHLFARFTRQMHHTYPHRTTTPRSSTPPSATDLTRALRIAARVLWHCGIRASYRTAFWRMALPALRRGDIEGLLHAALVGHHLITFTRDALAGRTEKAFYAP
jgi:hypothetical protein